MPNYAASAENTVREVEHKLRDAKDRMSAVIALRLFRPPLIATSRCEKQSRCTCAACSATILPAKSSGPPAPGALPAIGQSRMAGHAKSGTSPSPPESGLVLYRLVQDKLNGIGSWKACMTKF